MGLFCGISNKERVLVKRFSVLLEGQVEAPGRGIRCGGRNFAEVGAKASAGWSTPSGNRHLPSWVCIVPVTLQSTSRYSRSIVSHSADGETEAQSSEGT